ncbi:MAG TPA: hypothetical protein VJ204_00715, partial [Solirubrobacterales bacterium]|nr:hypothetical protein [Solirubrobacterales bacterium]
RSFADGGLFGGRDLGENPLGAETIGSPLVSRSGAITYRSSSAYVCEGARSHLGIARLTPEGQTEVAFGDNGALAGPVRGITEMPDGSVVALTELPHHGKQDFRARLIRISPDGEPDPTFGARGKTILRLAPGDATTLESLAVDPRGRLIIGGTLEAAGGRSLLLMRVSAKGVWDRKFGPHGRVATPEPRLTQFGVSAQFFDRHGRLITVHQIAGDGKNHSGLVVARYRPGV